MLRNGNECEKTKLIRISRQPSTVHILIDEKQLDIVEYLYYMQSLVTDGAICILRNSIQDFHVRSSILEKEDLFISKLDLNLRNKLVKCYILSIALCSAETWTLWQIDRKYLKHFEIVCWRRMEIRWTNCVKNEVLPGV
jgi:hypothetical protein